MTFCRREHEQQDGAEDHDEQHIGKRRADGAAHALLLQPVDRAAQAEHEDGGPDDDAHRDRKDVEQVHDDAGEQDAAHRCPDQ